MADQDKYSIDPSRHPEEILSHFNCDAKKMRANASATRIQAQQQAAQIKIETKQHAEQAAQQRAAIKNIPSEHRPIPDQAS